MTAGKPGKPSSASFAERGNDSHRYDSIGSIVRSERFSQEERIEGPGGFDKVTACNLCTRAVGSMLSFVCLRSTQPFAACPHATACAIGGNRRYAISLERDLRLAR